MVLVLTIIIVPLRLRLPRTQVTRIREPGNMGVPRLDASGLI